MYVYLIVYKCLVITAVVIVDLDLHDQVLSKTAESSLPTQLS